MRAWRSPAAPMRRGGCGGPISRPGSGGRCARTTPPTATPGRPSRSITPTPAPTGGAMTASPGSHQEGPVVRALHREDLPRRPAQGAALRPDQPAGQPRRGRQGVLATCPSPRCRASRTRRCSAATPTGAGRSGSPSTFCWPTLYGRMPRGWPLMSRSSSRTGRASIARSSRSPTRSTSG